MQEKSFVYDKAFAKQLKRVVKNNKDLEERVLEILDILKCDVFDKRLHTTQTIWAT